MSTEFIILDIDQDCEMVAEERSNTFTLSIEKKHTTDDDESIVFARRLSFAQLREIAEKIDYILDCFDEQR